MALEVKSHWGVVMEGEDVNQIELVDLLTELIEDKKLKIVITSAHVSTFYTPPSKKYESPSESPSEAKLARGSAIEVKQGGKTTS